MQLNNNTRALSAEHLYRIVKQKYVFSEVMPIGIYISLECAPKWATSQKRDNSKKITLDSPAPVRPPPPPILIAPLRGVKYRYIAPGCYLPDSAAYNLEF